MITLVFDIGVTKTRVGLSRDGRTLQAWKIISTDEDYQAGVRQIVLTGQSLLSGKKPGRIVGGFAGPLDQKKRRAKDSQLLDWIGRPLADDLQRGFGTPVQLENDAALNGLGEATSGAGKKFSIVGFLTISTGVNGVRITDGAVDSTAYGFELRHMLVSHGDKKIITLGQAISGRALEKKYGQHPQDITNQKIWSAVEQDVAHALINIALLWSPEVIVLGGSMFNHPGIRLPHVQKMMQRDWPKVLPMPKILRGALGDLSGLYGALALTSRQTRR